MNTLNRQYGYARVSSFDQNEARQVNALLAAGVDERFIMIDKATGKDFLRPHYQILKNALRPGDIVTIKSIDRLGRNYQEIIKEWREITQDLKADIQVLDMPLLDTTLHKDLLGTFISDLILQVLAYVAEQERNYIKQRQAEGLAAAKQRGDHLGRPIYIVPPEFVEIVRNTQKKRIKVKDALAQLNMKRTTFYKLRDLLMHDPDTFFKRHYIG